MRQIRSIARGSRKDPIARRSNREGRERGGKEDAAIIKEREKVKTTSSLSRASGKEIRDRTSPPRSFNFYRELRDAIKILAARTTVFSFFFFFLLLSLSSRETREKKSVFRGERVYTLCARNTYTRARARAFSLPTHNVISRTLIGRLSAGIVAPSRRQTFCYPSLPLSLP